MALKFRQIEFEQKVYEEQKKQDTTPTSEPTSVWSGDQEAAQAGLDAKYKDDNDMSARDAFRTLTDSGILNEHYYDRMVNAAERLVNNEDWVISMVDENGQLSDVALADAVAASFDSELDLYIEDAVAEVMAKYGTCSKGYLSDAAKAELAAKGIRIDAVGQGTEEDGSISNRVYSFTLVELPPNASEMTEEELMAAVYSDDAKVVEDAAGNKGSILFADCLIPDGYAQNAEINLSSILDTMGYDCISKADFIGADGKFDQAAYDAVVSEAEEYINSGEATATDTIHETYGNVKDISLAVKHLWGGSGSAPGQNGIGGDGELTAEEKAAQEQANTRYNQVLAQKIAAYEEEHGVKPTGHELEALEQEAAEETGKKEESPVDIF